MEDVMSLALVLDKLRAAPADPDRAEDLGRMAFLEWLETLPPEANFPEAAMIAFDRSRRTARRVPAAAVFRALLVEAVRRAPRPVDLTLPAPQRRGGHGRRREAS
jgi:hypothetical protein